MAAVSSYVDALKQKYQPTDTTTMTKTKFNKPLTCKPPRKFQLTFDPKEFPLLNKKACMDKNQSATSSVTMEHTTNTKQTTATTQQPVSLAPPPPKIDLVALKIEIWQSLSKELQQVVTKEIEPVQKQIELL